MELVTKMPVTYKKALRIGAKFLVSQCRSSAGKCIISQNMSFFLPMLHFGCLLVTSGPRGNAREHLKGVTTGC